MRHFNHHHHHQHHLKSVILRFAAITAIFTNLTHRNLIIANVGIASVSAFSEDESSSSSSVSSLSTSVAFFDSSWDECRITCEPERFDIGRDCADELNRRCHCIAHCCWAFDCRTWPTFAQCRKKCGAAEWYRFGASTGPTACDRFRCPRDFVIDWDVRDVTDLRRADCIRHCCYAFDCKRFSGYCRLMCLR